MIENPTFQIELVQARVAITVSEEAFAELDSAEYRLAQSMLDTLHSRHVGITPKMTASLSRIILNASLKPDQFAAPWQTVAAKLQQSLQAMSHLPDIHERPAEPGGARLRFNASVSYTVLRLAAPLVNWACEQIGRCYLFCADNDNIAPVDARQYRLYATSLERAINALVDYDDDLAHALFWQERALMLASMTLHRARGVNSPVSPTTGMHSIDEHRTLPLTNTPELALFLRLQPEMQRQQHRSYRQFALAARPDLRERSLPDAGADGIFVTRNPEDLNRMLVSEMIYPRLVRLDRMINSGYFAIERPPRPVRLRDALIVGLSPGAVNAQAGGVFVKTCWFEFLMRFSRILQQSDLGQSELRWIEGDAFRRLRTKSMLVQDLPQIPVRTGEEDLHAFRQHFLMKLGWLPAYLDDYAYYDELPALTQSSANNAEDRVRQLSETWLKAAWDAQKDNARWQTKADRGYKRKRILSAESDQTFSRHNWRLDQFAYIHLMLFLPQSLRDAYTNSDQNDDFSLARFRTLFQIKRRSGMSLSVTWIPDEINNAPWYFSSKFANNALIAEIEPGLDRIAGRLIELWLDNIMKEMQRG